ncbi:hypothetical protein [Pyrococcus abyssi]|uniref:Uncharacterized protein n=1 Tax=Pyrococcus abyssi (strain GE5 / Orsay) TaxID=272844 RepID=G8ZKL6_PYRAB|nr:hypothetical protein [Pyrococcus abyssi]CCE70659.1 TPA: hypothetical protein PAB1571.1n [Pyrococcus abyssi GE5]
MLRIYIVAFEFLDDGLSKTAIENIEDELMNFVIQHGSYWLSVEGYLLADLDVILEDKGVREKIAQVVQERIIR